MATAKVDDTTVDMPLTDPTLNVKEQLTAAIKRQDDMRLELGHRVDELRAAEIRRIDDLRSAETRRIDDLRELSRHFSELVEAEARLHDREMREAEAKRIDAVRNVDVEARKADNERAAAQALLLANQLGTTADTLRNQVATTNSANQQAAQQQAAQQLLQLQQLFQPLAEKVSVLEQQSYKGQGKEQVADPAMTLMATQVAALTAAQQASKGQGVGAGAVVGYIALGISILIGITTLSPLFTR